MKEQTTKKNQTKKSIFFNVPLKKIKNQKRRNVEMRALYAEDENN